MSRLFPRHKARPDQAGIVRRGLAFGVDLAIVGVLSFAVYLAIAEIGAAMSGEPGIVAQVREGYREGGGFTIRIGEEESEERALKDSFLKSLRPMLSEAEYERLLDMSAGEIYSIHQAELAAAGLEHRFIYVGEMFSYIREYVISLLYFVLFFRFGSRTPGKRLFRLKVLDLEGKPRLGWYQCFERAHGYVCSGLFASLGFWQVLWNKSGLTMHDKLAGTTVVKLPKKPRPPKPAKLKPAPPAEA